VIQRPTLPLAAPQLTLGLAETPRDAENQRPSEIGARVGEHIGRVGDKDAAGTAGLHVDVVVADRNVGDDPQVATGIQYFGIDTIGQQANQRVLTRYALEELRAPDRLAARVQIELTLGFEPGNY
jgi:hypothetical protein